MSDARYWSKDFITTLLEKYKRVSILFIENKIEILGI